MRKERRIEQEKKMEFHNRACKIQRRAILTHDARILFTAL